MNQKEVMEYLEILGRSGIVPGLDRIRQLLKELGDPQESLRFVHIAGTNGKGSTLAFTSTILQEAGYRVGRYISPAVYEYREKIQVNGRPISVRGLCDAMERVREACEKMADTPLGRPSVFEAETALSFLYFAEKKCQVVVLETGMGGLEDATNVIPAPAVTVLAHISMDHMDYLGHTLKAIAEQKAGIIKAGSIVVTTAQEPEAMEVIRKTCQEKGCRLRVADPAEAAGLKYGLEQTRFDYGERKRLTIHLAGAYQPANAILALEAAKACGDAGLPVSEEAIRKGLEKTLWPGRFQVLGTRPYFIADGAHNEDAALQLAKSLDFYFTNKKIIYIMGVLKDKDYPRILEITAKYADLIFTVTPPGNPRALPAYELARAAAEYNSRVTAVDSLEEAVEMAYLSAGKEDVILAFGSLSFQGKLAEIVNLRNACQKGGNKRKK